MSDTDGRDHVPGLTLAVEGPDGDETVAVAVPPPADVEQVMEAMQAIDEALSDLDPPLEDAVTAALLMALGNALRQAPEWPLEARLDSFLRRVHTVVDDVKARLDEADEH